MRVRLPPKLPYFLDKFSKTNYYINMQNTNVQPDDLDLNNPLLKQEETDLDKLYREETINAKNASNLVNLIFCLMLVVVGCGILINFIH